MQSKKILIVEDDKMLCTIFQMFVSELGHELLGFAFNGEAAIEKCKTVQPDIILMDIHLTGEINGFETASTIQDNYNIPIVFISSDTDEETVKKAIMKNTYGFLIKPIYRNSLGLAIDFAYLKFQFDNKKS